MRKSRGRHEEGMTKESHGKFLKLGEIIKSHEKVKKKP